MSSSKCYNGRINIMQPDTTKLFAMKDKIQYDNKATEYREALNGNWQDSILSKAYFSKNNIQILQNAIRAGVYKLSKNEYIIAPQCVDTLKIIMRSVFLQYSANMNLDHTQQIRELNKIVTTYCIPSIYNETKGYLKYLHDASTMHTPIDHPSQSGCYNKSLKPNPFV